MKKLLMLAIGAAAACAALAEEVNLRTIAVEDGSGNLVAYSDGHNVWASGREADKAFDGSISGNDFYDPRSVAGDTWTGYEVSTPCILTRIRYYGRTDATARIHLTSSLIQGANSADFSDAVTLHVPNPPKGYVGGAWVDEFIVPKTQAFKYFRIIEQYALAQRNTFAGMLRELEFHGVLSAEEVPDVEAAATAGVADVVPSDVTVSTMNFPNQNVIISVNVPRPYTEFAVLRAPGEGGPWTLLGTATDTASYTDTTCPVGVPTYYRVVSVYADTNGTYIFGGTNETVVSCRRWRLLERDPSDMTHLRSGVNVIYTCGTGGNLCWTPQTGTTLTAVTNSLMFAFNNVLWSESGAYSPAGYQYYYDFADTKAADPTCIGVDLGEPAHFAYLRFYPVARAGCNCVVGTGSNNANWSTRGNFDILTEETSGVEQGNSSTVRWIELESFDTETTYRYLFCHSTVYNGWNNNVSELQFYGWLESEVAGLASGVIGLSATCGTTPSVTLAWTPVQYGSTYKIERKTGDGAWEIVASAIPVATATWTDTGVTCDGTRYTYRVTTVNGANEAYSAEQEVRPYLAGNGTGLHGEWWTNYVITTGGEALALVTTNATIDIANASVGSATENIFARWSGKLIAPYAGDFTFEADADGVVCLWIDGNPVLHKAAISGTLALTAGEHDVTATWLHGSGTGHCRLLWGGCVTHEVIPATQFVPVVPLALPEGWANARLFARSDSVTCVGNVRVNGDGTIDFAYGGEDLSYSNNGYDFVWQTIKGDFTLRAVMESLAWNNSWWGPKAGLMVRNSLDASSMMSVYGVKRSGANLYVVGRQRTSAAPSSIYEQKMIDGREGANISYAPVPTYVKLRRDGNTFTFFYRVSTAAPWTKLYEYTDANGEYGETVYVGPVAFGEGGGNGDLAVPYYRWRFSNVELRTPKGTVFVVR